MISFEDGSIILHADAPYDPTKAHEYYLKTRKLHPRAKGSATFTVTRSDGKHVKLTAQQLQEQRVYAQHRVEQIKKNLSDLGVLLRDKLKKAKEAEAKAAKPPTLAEKAQAARDAAKYRASHKQEIATKAKQTSAKSGGSSTSATKPAAKTDTVESLKADITRTKNNLKKAVANQRALATAKKNG